MPDFELSRIATWLTSMRADRTQAEMAEDITATTGWRIDRTRYSRYENGSLPVGREVLGHLSDYARAKGFPPLDLTPPAPAMSLEERAVVAAERQADLMAALVAELQRDRAADRTRIEALERTVERLLAAVGPIEQAGGAPVAPRAPRG